MRDARTKIFPDRQWLTPFFSGSHQFADASERMLDARTMFHYCATGILAGDQKALFPAIRNSERLQSLLD
jgi:hypothetical protein